MPKLTNAVWQYRLDKMTALMDDLAVDALIFTSADFFQYATNFHTDVLPWERPIFAVVPRNGTPFLVMNELSTHHMRFSQEQGKVWITDISYYAEHPRVTNRLPLTAQLPEVLATRLKAAGLARSRIAVEGGSPVLAQVGRILPEIALRGATPECRSLRWQKHEEEIAVMAAAASISDWIQDRYRENIRPGICLAAWRWRVLRRAHQRRRCAGQHRHPAAQRPDHRERTHLVLRQALNRADKVVDGGQSRQRSGHRRRPDRQSRLHDRCGRAG